MRERQAASSIPALGQRGVAVPGPLDDQMETNDPQLRRVQEPTHHPPQSLSEALRTIEPQDTKANELITVLKELREARPQRKVLVFTFFKGTLRYLHERLIAAGIKTSWMSGDLKPQERAPVIKEFARYDDFAVLLTTEVGSEGIDLQFCDALINYDLPWNPMRVEQRIGRIDRFGQRQNPIDIWSFFVEGTIDTRILQRLYERIRVFEESIGELDPILGDVIDDLQTAVFDPNLTQSELDNLVDQKMLAVEKKRQLADEMELRWQELSVHRDLYRNQVHGKVESGRVITAEESMRLVDRWTAAHGGSLNEASHRPGVCKIRIPDEALDTVLSLTPGVPAPLHLRHIQERLAHDNEAWCTFDGTVAQSHPELPFVAHDSPLVQVALSWTLERMPRDPKKRVTTLVAPAEWKFDAPAALFVFEAVVSWPSSDGIGVAAKQERYLLPILASDRQPFPADNVLGQLDGMSPGGKLPSDEWLSACSDIAFKQASVEVEEMQRTIIATQQARQAQRSTAVCRTIEARLAMKRRLLEQATEPRIVRLHKGEIRNLEAQLRREQDQLSNLSEPTVGRQSLAICVILPPAENRRPAPAVPLQQVQQEPHSGNRSERHANDREEVPRDFTIGGWSVRWDSSIGLLKEAEIEVIHRWVMKEKPQELYPGEQVRGRFDSFGVPVEAIWWHTQSGSFVAKLRVLLE